MREPGPPPGATILTPVHRELPYRPLWPLAYALREREPGVAFLDSSCAPEAEGRWSILAWRPRRVVAWPQGCPGAMAAIRALLTGAAAPRPTDSPLPFHGGWIGWFAYDLGRHIERLPSRARSDPATPDFVLGEYDLALVEDRMERRLYLSGACRGAPGRPRWEKRVARALRVLCAGSRGGEGAVAVATAPRPALARDQYRRNVERVLAYIRAGDIYQANFAYHFESTVRGPSRDLYRRLRAASPAPYGAMLALPGGPELLSISPELFLRRCGERVVTRPIKGTRPRARDARHDAALHDALLHSEKECAELLMIVDLLRNDLGRVARVGSVRVERQRDLVAHPTVHHAVATIAAEVDRSVDAAALLAATLPGGSVTGAPKIRAMEILDELEDVRRGAYTGVAGYLGYDGDLCLNILIRTLTRCGNAVRFHVGGAIVADSDPDAEYAETLAKARALIGALTHVEA